MRSLIAVALAAVLVGCGDSDNDVDFGGEDRGPDLHAVVSEDGSVKMGLTMDYVYFALSDSARMEARREVEADVEGGGVSGFFSRMMSGVLGKALSFRAKYPVTEIRDIRWEDGRMRMEFTDPDRRIEESIQMSENDEPITRMFGEEAVQEFGAVFRALKEEGAAPER